MINPNPTILIAPNDDGYGTSAWAARLVKELARQRAHPIARVKIVTATENLAKIHADWCRAAGSIASIEFVHLSSILRPIRVPKRDGAVDVEATIQDAILPYADSRRQYADILHNANIFVGVDVVIDLGVPPLVRAAVDENAARIAAGRAPMRIVTFFDHSWALTLRQIAEQYPRTDAISADIEANLRLLEQDEAISPDVFLFNPPIAPDEYHQYWTRALGRPPRLIPGALGGPLATLAYFNSARLAEFHNACRDQGHCPPQAFALAKQLARQTLGINNDAPVLFVSGAGSGVWNGVLRNMVDQFVRTAPQYNVVMYSPADAGRLAVKMNLIPPGVQRGSISPNLIFIDRTLGDTHHVLFPAFDLVLTRAGGGTVNDAIAHHVPLVLVDEPGMWQVERIRQSALQIGFARAMSLEDLRRNPRQSLETPAGQLDLSARTTEFDEACRRYGHHAEMTLLQAIL